MRTYLADGEDAEVICLAARKLREKARTLSGDALGVEVDEPESDIVADLLDVMGGDAGLWWETAAERLAGAVPDAARGRHGRVGQRRGAGPRRPEHRRPVAARPRRHQPQGMPEGRPSRRGDGRESRGTCAALARHALTCANAARRGTSPAVPRGVPRPDAR